MKLDFTRGFPAAPFPKAPSFLSAMVVSGVLPCCSKKARNEETCASLKQERRRGKYWFGFSLIWQTHEGFVKGRGLSKLRDKAISRWARRLTTCEIKETAAPIFRGAQKCFRSIWKSGPWTGNVHGPPCTSASSEMSISSSEV
jgi:hypothetical protein